MKIGMISTINCECGIATYAQHLSEHYPVGDTIIFGNQLGVLTDTQSCLKHPIIRCWNRRGDFKELTQEIIKSGVKIAHFQHEFGLFQDNDAFCAMLSALKAHNIRTVITFHTVFVDAHLNDKITAMMPYLDMIIVHHENARKVLVQGNCVVVPHGSVLVKPRDKIEARKRLNIPEGKIVFLSFGFITPNKAAMDSISAVYRLRDDFDNLLFMIVGAPIVHGENFGNLEYCLSLFRRVKQLQLFNMIRIHPNFVSEEEIDWYAGAADIAIENYHQTQHSTSGMSHLVMSYGLPNISSTANILADLNDERSLKYNMGDIGQMTDNLRRLIRDRDLRTRMSQNCLKYAEETSWPRIAEKHLELYRSQAT